MEGKNLFREPEPEEEGTVGVKKELTNGIEHNPERE